MTNKQIVEHEDEKKRKERSKTTPATKPQPQPQPQQQQQPRHSPSSGPPTPPKGKRVFDDDPLDFSCVPHGHLPDVELDEILEMFQEENNMEPRVKEMFQEENNMEPRVKETYEKIAANWPTEGRIPLLASVESSLLAHKYYEEWAPRRGRPVNLMVMAAFHVYTDPSIVGAKANDGDATHFGHLNLPHCLSFGEPWMLPKGDLSQLDPIRKRQVDSGNKQVWRLLSTLAGERDVTDGSDPLVNVNTMDDLKSIFSHLESSGRKDEESELKVSRVHAKTRVLTALRDRGIMLADVSPIPLGGIYEKVMMKLTGSQTELVKLPEKVFNKAMKIAWEEYAKHMIKIYRPKNILLLGKKVEQAIGEAALLEAAEDVGGVYIGNMHHPSYSKITGTSFLAPLRVARHIAQRASKGEHVVLAESD